MTTSEAMRYLLTHKDHRVREAALALRTEIVGKPKWAQAESDLPDWLKTQGE